MVGRRSSPDAPNRFGSGNVRGIADPQGDGSLWTTLRNHDGPVCQVNLVTPGIATAYLPSASGSVGGSASQA